MSLLRSLGAKLSEAINITRRWRGRPRKITENTDSELRTRFS